MSIGEGIGQGLMFLANNIAQNKRADKDQQRQIALMNMRNQNELAQEAAKRAALTEEKNTSRKRTGEALKNLNLVQGDFTPEQLGTLAEIGLVDNLYSQQTKAADKKVKDDLIANLLANNPDDPILKKAIQLEQADLDSGLLRVGAQMQGDEALARQRDLSGRLSEARMRKLDALLPLEQQALRARAGASNASAAASYARAAKTKSGGGGKGGSKAIKRYDKEAGRYVFYDPNTGMPVGGPSSIKPSGITVNTPSLF